MATVIKGNKREVPPDIPIMAWWEMVQEYRVKPWINGVPFYSWQMEHLSPEELATIRAKVRVWVEITGAWPGDISCWWEVRMARRRGDLPHSNEIAAATIDEQGVLHCGKCQARWSPPHDGGDWPERCKLCDARWTSKLDREAVCQ